MLWANAVCTSYDVYIATMDLLYGNGKILDVLGSLIKGMTIGMLITCMLTLPIAIVTRPLLIAYGIKEQSELLLAAIEKGDPIEIGVRVLQCITLVYGFGAQCFTGETLVETDEGMVAIEDIEVGDYVLAEDTVTGEQEYKEVLDVHVSQTTKLVHVVTSGSDDNNLLFGLDKEETSTTINTTDNHPFYVEGKGWVPAIELEAGDILRTADGDVEVVNDVYVEYLDEPVLIYNLEIEGYHTYFVSDESVLVHNNCETSDGDNNDSVVEIELPRDRYPESAKHIEDAIADGQPTILTIERNGASTRRKASLDGVETIPGLDRDEYPPAMSAEGGKGSSVRHIAPSDNRGSGPYLSIKLRQYPNGTKYKIVIGEGD